MYWWIAGSLIAISALVTHTVGEYGSQCQLPNQQVGLCMPVRSCKPIYEMLLKIHQSGGIRVAEESQNSLTTRHCGTFRNQPHICCDESDIQLNPDGLAILKNQSCGAFTTDKVSFGKEAALLAFPWMAVLVYNSSDNRYRCAGSLISERYVLTAAHCLTSKTSVYQVRLGEHRFSTERDCTARGRICAPPVEDIDVEETIMHEKYFNSGVDIALLRLKRKVEYKVHIKPLCLPIYDNLRGAILKHYIISGWGQTENELHADVLMAASVPYIPLADCKLALQQLKITYTLPQGVICAGNSNFTDSCIGDSGGPLGYRAMYNGHPKFVQYGVVGTGVNFCGDGNSPNAYPNVSYHLQWITDNMKY